jgi:hypothetical protein
MSDKDFQRKVAKAYLEGFDKDPLLGLKDIDNYHEPNFIDHRTGKFYLVRCYQCPDVGSYGRENYGPNVSTGGCVWCGWKPDPRILGYIKATKIMSDTDPFFDDGKCQAGQDFGMTIEDIRRRYPDQYDAALRAHKAGRDYIPNDQEDDGEID